MLQGQKVDMQGWEINGMEMHFMKDTGNKLKIRLRPWRTLP